jgi:hypothetical protein
MAALLCESARKIEVQFSEAGDTQSLLVEKHLAAVIRAMEPPE